MADRFKRTAKPEEATDNGDKPVAVSAGAVDKALDLAFNPSREKIREVTIVDRLQGRLLPLLDLVNLGQKYILEIAQYRLDPIEYKKAYQKTKPKPPEFFDELMYRIAQWQKSIIGKNLEKITDIALAEMESRSDQEQEGAWRGDAWEDK